jgi:hypothetical protein
VDLERALHGGTIRDAAGRLQPGGIEINSQPRNVITFPLRASVQPKLVATETNPLAFPYVLSDDEIRECHRYALRLLEDRAYMGRVAGHRQWHLDTVRGLTLDGYLGLDDQQHLCFNSPAGCKSRWRENGERRFRFHFGKSWLWRGDLIPRAETVYLCEGETDAISLIDCGMEDDWKTTVIGMQGATFNIEPWAFLFTGKDVIISTDYDEAGRKAAQKIETSLSVVARSISYLDLEEVAS